MKRGLRKLLAWFVAAAMLIGLSTAGNPAIAAEDVDLQEAASSEVPDGNGEVESFGGGMEAQFIDPDPDDDGIITLFDNCPWTYNPDQINSDLDLEGGDACDSDFDPTIWKWLGGKINVVRSCEAATISWTRAILREDIPLTYRVFVDDVAVGDTTSLSMELSGLTPNVQHTVKVRVSDTYGHWAEEELRTTIKVEACEVPDTEGPVWDGDGNLSLLETCGLATLSWDPAEDESGVSGYRVYRDEVFVGETTETYLQFSGLAPGTSYTFTVTGVDTLGNESVPGITLHHTTGPAPSAEPTLTWIAPNGDHASIGQIYEIKFRWGSECGGYDLDRTVAVTVRNAANNAVIASFAYGNQISYADGVYTLPFDTSRYPALQSGGTVRIQVYFGGKGRGATLLEIK